MRFDPSGLSQAFDRMQKAAKDKGKELATNEANIFLRLTRRLGWKVAPTREELVQVALNLKWRLKRKPGVTPARELARRQAARGTFARGWTIGKVEQAGTRIRIWIVNAVNYAGIVEDRSATATQAANIVGSDYKNKLQRMAEQVTSIFK